MAIRIEGGDKPTRDTYVCIRVSIEEFEDLQRATSIMEEREGRRVTITAWLRPLALDTARSVITSAPHPPPAKPRRRR